MTIVLLLGSAGIPAGWLARWILARLRRGAEVRPGWCEAGIAVLWASAARADITALPLLLALGWLGVALSATDIIHRRLPDALTLPALPLAIGLTLPLGTAAHAVAGAAILTTAYALVHLAAPAALGAGDVKLAGAVGAVLGGVSWAALLLGPLLAALLTAAAGVAGLLAGRLGHTDPVPHGPAMLAAAWTVALLAHGA